MKPNVHLAVKTIVSNDPWSQRAGMCSSELVSSHRSTIFPKHRRSLDSSQIWQLVEINLLTLKYNLTFATFSPIFPALRRMGLEGTKKV
jgi:hypothetical protein